MNQPKPAIRNIIFDLGGVLIDLDVAKTVKAFNELAVPVPTDQPEIERRARMYAGLETGTVSPGFFRKAIRELSPIKPSDEAIDNAWNAMLSDFPGNRVKTLQKLKGNYRIFLLSNSNEIHFQYYANRFKQEYAMEMDALFEQTYYSFVLNMCKPRPEIFQKVLKMSGLLAEETLFIDDTAENVDTAASLGMITHQIVPGQEMADLFSDGLFSGNLIKI